MPRTARPLFKRSYEFVAVRRIRLGANVYVEKGEELKGFKQFHLRSLYQRRRIGPKGHPWTDMMLGTKGMPKLAPKDPEPSKEDKTDNDVTVEPVKVGSQWLLPAPVDKKFTSKKKAVAWLKENEDAVATMVTELAELNALVGTMEDDVLAHYETLDEDDQAEFLGMSDEDRVVAMAEDEVEDDESDEPEASDESEADDAKDDVTEKSDEDETPPDEDETDETDDTEEDAETEEVEDPAKEASEAEPDDAWLDGGDKEDGEES